MGLYRRVDGEGLGWIKRNWQWLRIGVIVVFLVGVFGILMGALAAKNNDAEEEVIGVPFSTTVEAPSETKQADLTGKKLVALTFDDGPNGATTPRLLDVLRGKSVRATFFVLGSNADRNTSVILRENNDGHEIGSHSMWHKNLSKLSGKEVKADILESKGIIKRITGKEVSLVRPPYGATGGEVLGNLGSPAILWTVDSLDWKSRDAEAILTEVKNSVFDGAIILMHDIYDSTVDAVGRVIDELRGQGYEFVTVSELAELRGVEMVNGVSYGGFRP